MMARLKKKKKKRIALFISLTGLHIHEALGAATTYGGVLSNNFEGFVM